MKKALFVLITLTFCALHAHAVLKEKDLEQTLGILRKELTTSYNEQNTEAELRQQQNSVVIRQLMETMKRSNQNALMLYSQKVDYVFDLTYACHEATEQYQQFHRQQLPFRQYIEKTGYEVAKYDSLINSLESMPVNMLSQQARIDRSVCLALATNIRNTLMENSQQMTDYMHYYANTEQRLRSLNDYALKRYNDIQTSIFRNGGADFYTIVCNLRQYWDSAWEVMGKKYKLTGNESVENMSQWSLGWILGLFLVMMVYALAAVLLNQLVFRFLMPRRLKTEDFMKKRSAIIMATTTITFALIMGIMTNTSGQNFLVMASNLLVEFAWLMSVILVSLLLRVGADQLNNAFRIYAPLLIVTFIVIAFRIALIPSEMVNLVFPMVLLACTAWQWLSVRRHKQSIPRSDMVYTYISLLVFFVSLGCSWIGYTLLSVQLLIWWTMQLTCILTITCLSTYVHAYGDRHGLAKAPITKSWLYLLLYRVVLPILGVLSVMVSIYWAASVFNLTDLCWRLFNANFVDQKNLQLSIMKLTVVVCLWFLFRYVVQTVLALMRQHYEISDPSTAASKEVMGRNVIQVLVWGIWLLISLSILNISVAWLLAISGGLSTGIGFASKDIIENIYYGASLMAGRIKVGDWIQVDGTMGKVASISYTSTIIESLYGEVITFQNSQLFAKNYKNLTKNHGYVLAVVPFGVAYGSNLRQVTELVEQAVGQLRHQWMDHSKAVKAVVSEMADSSINFNLFVWVEAPKRSHVVSDVLKCVYETLGQNNISIPFPQRDVHIIKET
ncbi:MAG: mechanosensitive ion channel family protein [Prevotella sp.]|nr:mechanosensitive ion channel family protein [Prevotella sp.]